MKTSLLQSNCDSQFTSISPHTQNKKEDSFILRHLTMGLPSCKRKRSHAFAEPHLSTSKETQSQATHWTWRFSFACSTCHLSLHEAEFACSTLRPLARRKLPGGAKAEIEQGEREVPSDPTAFIDTSAFYCFHIETNPSPSMIRRISGRFAKVKEKLI